MSAGSRGINGGVSAFAVRWRVTMVVAAISFAMAFSSCYISWRGEVEERRDEFQDRIDGFASAIAERLDHYETAMEMSRGLFAASGEVTRAEWGAYTTSEGFFEWVPGAYGFAYIERVPAEEIGGFKADTRADGAPGFEVFDTDLYEPAAYGDYCVIKYIEPMERNANALGLNVASIPASSDTMRRSVKHGRVAVSHSLSLQQTGASQVGIVMYLPIFPRGADVSTAQARSRAVTGWVAMSIATTDFLSGEWASQWRDIDVVLCETSGSELNCQLYASPGIAQSPEVVMEAPARLRSSSVISVGEWDWVLHGRDPHPPVGLISMPVVKVGAVGGVIGLLLVLLAWSLTRTRDRARQLAGELTVSLRRSEQRYALAINGSQEGLWDWDLATGKVYYAPRWKELLGLAEDEVGDLPEEWFGRIVSSGLAEFHLSLTRHIEGETDRFDIEVEMYHADGQTRWMLCRAAAVRGGDGKAIRLTGSLADITDLKQAQNELLSLAHHDRLTGLANRTLLTDRLGHAIARVKRNPGYQFAVLFLDFDRFKVINDSMGHGVGDRLLVGMAERILGVVREVDTVARFGGDEFVVLVDGVNGIADAEVLSDRLLAALAEPFSIDACEIVSTASIGVVGSEFGYEKAEDVIRDADAAMYQAKAEGKARYCLFDAQMHTQAVRCLKLEQDLRLCDFQRQFQVYYQPIINLDTGELSGFEALVRWDHPEHGQIQPDEFIGIAEDTGLIVELGEWVLVEACMQLARWRMRFGEGADLSINVNLSKRQLMHADLLSVVSGVLERTGIPPSALTLEITETTVMENTRGIISVMKQIRELGVRLAIDDFGTGHSSLSCLHQFPIDQLKIDHGFIKNMQDHREFAAVMDAIVSLAHCLHLDVVAEGIENADQLVQLQAMDCRFGQGYLFARPMPAIETFDYLASHLDGHQPGTFNAA